MTSKLLHVYFFLYFKLLFLSIQIDIFWFLKLATIDPKITIHFRKNRIGKVNQKIYREQFYLYSPVVQ